MNEQTTTANDTHIVMISGGIDSVALAYFARKERMAIETGVFIDYGQEAAGQELHAARATTLDLGIPFEPVNISGLKYLFHGLLDGPYHPMMAEACGCRDPMAAWGIVATYSLLRGIKKMLVGIVKEDVERIPGFPQYIEHFNAANSAIHDVPFQVIAPFIDMSKSNVIQGAVKNGIDLSKTWCCYGAGPYHCGECGGCERRKKAFDDAKVKDHVRYV